MSPRKHHDKVGPVLTAPVSAVAVEEPPLNHRAAAPVFVETVLKGDPLPGIHIGVDWNTIPMDQARLLYADLKSHFEKAGAILNNRSMPRESSYVCFMCKTRHEGDPRGKDYSRVDPATGLMLPVSICGERCWIAYQDMCIKERKANEMFKELGYDAEQRRQLFGRYDKNLEGLINELGQRIQKAKQ